MHAKAMLPVRCPLMRGVDHTGQLAARNGQVPPDVPLQACRPGARAPAPFPAHEHLARSPLVPLLALLREVPPGRPPHAHATIRTRPLPTR